MAEQSVSFFFLFSVLEHVTSTIETDSAVTSLSLTCTTCGDLQFPKMGWKPLAEARQQCPKVTMGT